MNRRRWAVGVGAALALGACVCFWYRMSWTVVPGSDWAAGALEARAVLSGNVLLHGWWMATDSYYFTDLPFWVAAVAVRGVSEAALHLAPAVIFSLALAAAAAVGGSGRRAREAVAGAAAAAAVVAYVALRSPGLLLAGETHVGTLLFCLAAIVAATGSPGAGGRRRWAGAAVLLALACFSDPITLGCGAGGLAGAEILAARRRVCVERGPSGQGAAGGSAVREWALQCWRPCALIGGACAAAFAARHLWPMAGGFTLVPYPAGFASPPVIAGNLSLLWRGWLEVFGVAGAAAPAAAVRSVPAAACALGFLSWGADRLRGRRPGRTDDALAVGGLLILGGFVVSTLPSAADTARYLTIPSLFGGMLAARRLAAWATLVQRQWVVAAVGASLCAVAGGALRVPATSAPQVALAQWLEAHRLYVGYGDYQTAAVTTVASDGRVAVRQVVGAPSSPQIDADQWESWRGWYAEPLPRPSFLVLTSPPLQGVAERSAVVQWGRPSRVAHVDGYIVLVWRHAIWAPP